MKKRDIAIDLTAFLDVVLILMFFALIQNTGGIVEYRAQIYEMETQLVVIQQEQHELEYALADANERLVIFSDWDYERNRLEGELGALNAWHTIVADAANFTFVHMNIDNGNRVVAIETSPGVFTQIEIFWESAGGNAIVNESAVLQYISTVLYAVANEQTGNHPMLVVFSYCDRVARQEYSLIGRGIRLFADNSTHGFQIYYSTHRRS